MLTPTRFQHSLSRRQAVAIQLLAGLGVLGAVVTPLVIPVLKKEPQVRALQHQRFALLELGASKETARRLLGDPGFVCHGKEDLVDHQLRGGRERWRALVTKTHERWVYPLPYAEVRSEEEPASQADRDRCTADYAEGEIGFDDSGLVLWFIEAASESYLVF